MICPKCGAIYFRKKSLCNKCEYDLGKNTNTKRCIISSIAGISFIVTLGLLITICTLSAFELYNGKSFENSFKYIVYPLYLLSIVASLIAYIRIPLSKGKLYGLASPKAILVLTAVLGGFLSYTMPMMVSIVKSEYRTFKTFGKIIEQYVNKNERRVPIDENWTEKTDLKKLDITFKKAGRPTNIAINRFVAGEKVAELPDKTVIAFETAKTIMHRPLYNDGIKYPNQLEIQNRNTADFYVIYSDYTSVNCRPAEAYQLNWFNDDQDINLPTVDNYLTRQAIRASIVKISLIVLACLSVAIMLWLLVKKVIFATIIFIITACPTGTYLGMVGVSLHNRPSFEPMIALYTSLVFTLLAAVVFSYITNRSDKHLTKEYLRHFNTGVALAIGCLCSICVHGTYILLNMIFSPGLFLLIIAWGIVGGSIMALIANSIVFRKQLKRETSTEAS